LGYNFEPKIPITYVFENLTADLKQEQVSQLTDKFNLPNLSDIDDEVANGNNRPPLRGSKAAIIVLC
jgi:hypothetical protein